MSRYCYNVDVRTSNTPRQTSEITVATANTHFGYVIKEAGGLEPFEQYAPDILLLQEVANPKDELEEQLGRANYTLIHAIDEFGLTIALCNDSNLELVADSIETRELGKMGLLERRLAQKWAKHSHAITGHGMLSATFRTEDGHPVTVVSTRITVSSNRIARKRQIAQMSQELQKPNFAGPLIIGGDMNHFPRPQQVDLSMYDDAHLRQVNLGNQPTWQAPDSTLYRLIARVRRQSIENLSAQLDALLYREGELELSNVAVVNTISDHRAIVGKFKLKA
jgi:endonuclease/exonuclease/phosphatase family metal-dependent hydrolase